MNEKRYETASALRAAVKVEAKKARSSENTQPNFQTWVFDRFLCRVFQAENKGGWVLKGGTAMLARLLDARATTDIDLLYVADSRELAIKALSDAASQDLGDFLSFTLRDYENILESNNVPYLDGVRVRFDVLFGAQKQEQTIKVDLCLTRESPGSISAAKPANRVSIQGLETADYALYSLENQVADKVCAMLQKYPGGGSSRVKDLVDLVLIANSFQVEAKRLDEALEIEFELREMLRPIRFVVDRTWELAYLKMARTLPSISHNTSLDNAEKLVNAFVFSIPIERGRNTQWSPTLGKWT